MLQEVVFTSSYKSVSSFDGSEKVTSVLGGCKTDSYTCSCGFRLFLFFLKHITIVKAASTVKNAKVDTSPAISIVVSMVLPFSADSVGRSVQNNKLFESHIIIILCSSVSVPFSLMIVAVALLGWRRTFGGITTPSALNWPRNVSEGSGLPSSMIWIDTICTESPVKSSSLEVSV